MTPRRPRRILAAILLSLGALAGAPRAALADESPSHEAARHFQRGVALYGEADYRAALVEFKRAYVLSPNGAVLYNVGEAEYQLQDYANALTTFERYLSEASPQEAHRSEVENNVEVLKARVGHVSVSTVPPGADITIDDQSVGHTPLDKPLLVSVGRRKIVATMAGRLPVTKYVDVATDDNVNVSVPLPAQAEATSSLASSSAPGPAPGPHRSGTGEALRTAGWIATGVLAAAAATFGIVAVHESSELKTERDSFPASPAVLSHDATLTTRYSVVADALTAAAVTVGGITLVSTLTQTRVPSGRGSVQNGTRLVLGPASARFEVTF